MSPSLMIANMEIGIKAKWESHKLKRSFSPCYYYNPSCHYNFVPPFFFWHKVNWLGDRHINLSLGINMSAILVETVNSFKKVVLCSRIQMVKCS